MKILSSQIMLKSLQHSLLSDLHYFIMSQTKAEHQSLFLSFHSEAAALAVQCKFITYLTTEVKQDSCKASQRGLHRLK